MAEYRDRWLFLSGVAMMSWITVPTVLQRELYAMAHQAGEWTEAHARSKLQAVFRTAHRAVRGERVEYAGMEVDPRNRFTNQRIIEELEVTADEEREMRTIISDEERRRRDRARKNPEMDRKQYLTKAAKRRAQARRLAAQGRCGPDSRGALKVSVHTVRSYLYRDM